MRACSWGIASSPVKAEPQRPGEGRSINVERSAHAMARPPRFVVHERSYDAEPSVDRHPFLQVVIPERGWLEMRIGGERGRAEGVRFAFIPSGVEHHYWSSGPNRFLVLNLDAALISEARQRLERPGSLPDEAFPPIHERLAAFSSLLRAELASGGLSEPMVAEHLGLYAGTVLHDSRGAGMRECMSPPGTHRLAMRTQDFLEACVLEPLTISQIAEAVGASPAHMQRAFRARFGVTIVAYVQGLRLARAKDLLRATDMTVTEVAFATGFNDHGYFTRLFSRAVGLAPTRYRAASRAESGDISR